MKKIQKVVHINCPGDEKEYVLSGWTIKQINAIPQGVNSQGCWLLLEKEVYVPLNQSIEDFI